MASITAILDANVLIPAAVRDTLLRAAEYRLFTPLWSDDILIEVERNLVEHGMTTPYSARRLIQMITLSFPTSLVTGYSAIVDELMINTKDMPVLGAAIVAGCKIIITENLRDFPVSLLQPHGVEALSSDQFLMFLFEEYPDTMTRIIQEQVTDLGDPPVSVNRVLNSIALSAPHFVALVRSRIADSG